MQTQQLNFLWEVDIKITVEVKDCRDCPYAKQHRGHGECWTFCANPKHNRPTYGDILWGCGAQFTKTPEWCPLKKEK